MEEGALFRADESLRRPPSADFQCWEDTSSSNGASVTFSCTVSSYGDPTPTGTATAPLVFGCRQPSYGVLTSQEPSAEPKEETTFRQEEDPLAVVVKNNIDDIDQHDGDYTYDDPFQWIAAESYPYALAQRTGFQIWPGTRIIVDALRFPRSTDHENDRLLYWQQRSILHSASSTQTLRVLELGAGVGLVGASLAAAGAQVLLTDLPWVVKDSLIPNLQRNAHHNKNSGDNNKERTTCLLYTSPSPRDQRGSRMPSSA